MLIKKEYYTIVQEEVCIILIPNPNDPSLFTCVHTNGMVIPNQTVEMIERAYNVVISRSTKIIPNYLPSVYGC